MQTTINSLQAEAKRAALENTKSLENIIKDTMDNTQKGIAASEEAKSAAREAVAIGKLVSSMAKEIRNKGTQLKPTTLASGGSRRSSYRYIQYTHYQSHV
jgi:hypothetical protein